MKLFSILFPLTMLLTPALFLLFFAPRGGADVDHERIRRLRTRLWGWTTASVVLFVVLFLGRDSAVAAWWTDLPWIVSFKTQPHQLAWLAFFPLWFVLAVPLLAACRPEAAGSYPRGRRGASLVARDSAPVVPDLAWLPLLLLWLGAAIVCGIHPPVGRGTTITVLFSLFGAALPIVIGFTCAKRVLAEQETLDPTGSEELRSAYASLRALRAWGFFWFAAAMLLLFSTLAILTVFGFERAGTLGGAIGGSLIGIGGATFGVLAGTRRMRIQRRLEELSGGAPSAQNPLP